MESKMHQKNIFECGFDSFEFDDGFLMKVDLDLKDLKNNHIDQKKVNGLENHIGGKHVKKKLDIKTHYYDSPLFIEDFNESEFFDVIDKKREQSPKFVINHKNEKSKKESFPYNFVSCLSPIQGPKFTNQMNLSSSTPVKSPDNSNPKETVKDENSGKNFDYDYLDADLFDDWSTNSTQKSSQKSTVTMSQALKLIEEAKSGGAVDEKETLNQSIDLLTGEIVGADVGIMFEESFGLPKSEKKQNGDPNDSVVVIEKCEITTKPPAAQKLNFNLPGSSYKKICFSSDDDDFDFLTQDLLEKPTKSGSKLVNSTMNCDLNDSADVVLRKKRGKCFNVIESDSTEDSPSPKFKRKTNTSKRFQKNFGKEFIDSEAEVSDVVEVSSDEAEEEGEYDKSFLDEESYLSQNSSANMTTKYLESVKGINRAGSFKIPASKPYDPINVFSQIPEENTDYEIDSFCVKDVEEEINTDLSDLEVAEKILEMDRKKRKRKKWEKTRKLK